MDANEYQRLALRTWNNEDDALGLMYLGGKLCAESGETMQLIAKWIMHGKEYPLDDMRQELGDIMWYVSVLASVHDLTLGEIMHANIAKLIQRHPNGDTRAFYQGD